MRPSRRFTARLAALGLWAAVAVSPGCIATLTGVVTGPFTGFVDGPAEVSRAWETDPGENEELWLYNALLVAPGSFAAGPFFGLVKGIATDVHCWFGSGSYGSAFGGYDEDSIWRPMTLRTPEEKALKVAKTSD